MKCPFFWLLVHGVNREWVPLGDRAVSKLRLWPCVHNFMNTHTLYNHCSGYFQLSVYYSSKFTHCIHPLWSRGNPHHLAANPHLHSCCLTGFYPSWNTGHFWFLCCCVHKLHFCLGLFFFNMYLVISHSFTKRRTCHMIYTCVCFSLPFPEADSSANYSILGPLEAHWMNEWDCL